MTATIGLVLDCSGAQELARFWSDALGYTMVGGAGSYVMLIDPDGVRPKLLFQAVAEAKAGKNRMHLDIETPDIEAEARRLESLGARRLEVCFPHLRRRAGHLAVAGSTRRGSAATHQEEASDGSSRHPRPIGVKPDMLDEVVSVVDSLAGQVEREESTIRVVWVS